MPRKGDKARQLRAKVAEETYSLARHFAQGVPGYPKTAIQRTAILDDRSIPIESTKPAGAAKGEEKASQAPESTATKAGGKPTGACDAAVPSESTGTEPAAEVEGKAATLPAGKASGGWVAPVSVSVVNEDTLDAATRLHGEGLNPLILNMASDAVPGGGWLTGAGAQEEQLFYRTALCVDLGYCHPKQKSHPFDPERKWRYPLKPSAVIHSPSVAVLRSSEADGYEKLKAKDRFLASFVSIAALRNPKLATGGNDYAKDGDRDKMRAKIEAMFRVAITNGYDSMVLGAFGCGAFRNPAPAVAQLFMDAIAKYQNVAGFPKRIVFAVFDPKADSSSNFSIFSAAFQNKA